MCASFRSRLFLSGCLLLPVFSADANLNRGESPFREISSSKLADFRPSASPLALSFPEGSTAHCLPQGPVRFDARETAAGESIAEKEAPGDEKYFGSATWSQVSKPRMVDFSFGQPCGPLSWWEPSDAESSPVFALATPARALPKTTPEWGNVRARDPLRQNSSTSAGVAVLSLSLLGVLGLVLRRGH